MNIVAELHKTHAYSEIAQAIRAKTGRRYSRGHLSNVANNLRPVSDSLRYNLMQTYPEFFLKHESSIGDFIASIGELVREVPS